MWIRGVATNGSTQSIACGEGVPASHEEPADRPGARRPRLRDERPDLRVHGGAVRLRQEHLPEHRVGRRDADVGERHGDDRRRQTGAPRLRLPGRQASAVAHRAGQHHVRPERQERGDDGQGAQVPGRRRAHGLRGHVPGAPVGRHAAARRHRQGAVGRARPAPHGRTVQPPGRHHRPYAAERSSRRSGRRPRRRSCTSRTT